MKSYIRIKKSHYSLLSEVPIYKKSSGNQYVLYKSNKKELSSHFLNKSILPDLYIHKSDRKMATKEISDSLNKDLYLQIKNKNLIEVKNIVIEIFNESVAEQEQVVLDCLPETIELLFNGYSERINLIIELSKLSRNDNLFAEHSANVMFLVMNYCIHCNYSESDVKRLSLMGLLHDIGKIRFPYYLRSPDHFLSNDEFEIYKTHPILGHAILKKDSLFDESLARGVLEHHEKLDKSGYPRGIKNISYEGQLLNIIDSFEQLAYSENKYRKAKRPFDAMSIIKSETLQNGKFDKEIFKNLCLSFSG